MLFSEVIAVCCENHTKDSQVHIFRINYYKVFSLFCVSPYILKIVCCMFDSAVDCP